MHARGRTTALLGALICACAARASAAGSFASGGDGGDFATSAASSQAAASGAVRGLPHSTSVCSMRVAVARASAFAAGFDNHQGSKAWLPRTARSTHFAAYCCAQQQALRRALNVTDPASLSTALTAPEFVGTIFVPSDAAWDAFLRAAKLTTPQLFVDAPLVAKLARHHVVPHVALRALDFTPGQALATLSQEARGAPRIMLEHRRSRALTATHRASVRQTLRVMPTQGVYVVVSARSSAAITVADIESPPSSIIHIVDEVLIPSSVRVQLR